VEEWSLDWYTLGLKPYCVNIISFVRQATDAAWPRYKPFIFKCLDGMFMMRQLRQPGGGRCLLAMGQELGSERRFVRQLTNMPVCFHKPSPSSHLPPLPLYTAQQNAFNICSV
jgi:hypothetical protein